MGATQTRQAAFVKRHLPDMPLSELDSGRVDELLEVLRLRPTGQDGKPVSVAWTQGCIKRLRHFLRWLKKQPAFGWKRPADLELERVRIPLTQAEKAAQTRTVQIQTYLEDELKTLYQYATPFQRLLMLLALNCAFGRAEVASLELAEVLLHQKHPHEREASITSHPEDSWILRIRHKSGVYGEWKLWPTTVAAVEWWLGLRANIAIPPSVTTLLVTRKGQRYDAPTKGNHTNFQIPNSWFQLTERVRKDHHDFRKLSFNKLRKTAGNLMRREAGGEVAAVFLCHGTPFKGDDLLDVYTNRPFPKVFQALDHLGTMLEPLWAGVTDPFPPEPRRGGPNIGAGKIRRIEAMRRQGFKIGYIARELDVSRETVLRWAKRVKLDQNKTPNDTGDGGAHGNDGCPS
jgi:hypothetical protein